MRDTLTINRVKSTCSCVDVESYPEEILPGCKGEVRLTFCPKNHPGTIDTPVFVYLSSSINRPVARLTLFGKVLPGKDEWERYPYAIGDLRLKQNQLEFHEMTVAKRPSGRILCGNSGTQPLRLSVSAIPEFASFRTEPAEIAPGSEADLVVTINGSLIPADKGTSFTFPIVIEGVNDSLSKRTLNIKINYIK